MRRKRSETHKKDNVEPPKKKNNTVSRLLLFIER